MTEVVQVVLNGVLTGLVYGLVALSFIVIYRSARILNLAQGQVLVIGALILWSATATLRLPLLLALPLGFAGSAIVGLALERIVFRPLIGRSGFTVVMASIALMILLQGAAQAIWGAETRAFPQIFPAGAWRFGPFSVNATLLVGGVLTLMLTELLHWFFLHTREGLRLAAVAEDHYTALSMGISIERASRIAWMLGSLIATLAAMALLSGRLLGLSAAEIGIVALPVALLGGLELVRGAPLAGVIVGVGEALASAYLDPLTNGMTAKILPFLLMIGVLLVRPQGLFGWKTIERL